jgi:hypothetical protein
MRANSNLLFCWLLHCSSLKKARLVPRAFEGSDGSRRRRYNTEPTDNAKMLGSSPQHCLWEVGYRAALAFNFTAHDGGTCFEQHCRQLSSSPEIMRKRINARGHRLEKRLDLVDRSARARGEYANYVSSATKTPKWAATRLNPLQAIRNASLA